LIFKNFFSLLCKKKNQLNFREIMREKKAAAGKKLASTKR